MLLNTDKNIKSCKSKITTTNGWSNTLHVYADISNTYSIMYDSTKSAQKFNCQHSHIQIADTLLFPSCGKG